MQKQSEGFLSRTLRPPSVWWPSGSSLPSSASAALSHGLASMCRLTPAGSANNGPGRKSETGRRRPGELPPPSLPQVAAPLPPSPSPLSAGHPIPQALALGRWRLLLCSPVVASPCPA